MNKMNKSIFIIGIVLLLIAPLVLAESNLVYSLKISYDGNSISEKGFSLIEGSAPGRIDEPDEGFKLNVVDFNDKVLHSFKFTINIVPIREAPRDIFDDSGNQIKVPEEETLPQQTEIVLTIPYFSNAKSIEILDENNNLMLSVDVSKYAQKSSSFENNLIYFIVGGIVLILIALLIYKRKSLFKKIKKVAKKEGKKIAELEKSIEEHKKHIAELKKNHKKKSKKHKD